MTKKSLISLIFVGIAFYVLAVMCYVHKPSDYSNSEKRKLSKLPEISLETVVNKKFMDDFESYAQDQFPGREMFRKAAAFFSCNVLQKADSHDIYMVDGSAAKLDYPLNESSVEYAVKRFGTVYDKYLKDAGCNIYLSIIPDKGYFLAPVKNYPAMDYDGLVVGITLGMNYAGYIDIFDTLDAQSYYLGDPHWRSEKIGPAAEKIATAMGVTLNCDYTVKTLSNVYRGTYAGQSALMIKDEYISYIDNEVISSATVNNLENNTVCGVYDYEKGEGRDPYEFFLSGPVSLMEIHNEAAASERKLIMFRDSYGSSIAPYFIEAYSEIVLIDIRYLSPEILGKFVDFEGADVLFIYSTSVLNHSETIK